VTSRHRSLYAAFDRVPSPKGAATHIERFAGALFEHAGGGCLFVLGSGDLAAHEQEGGLEVFRFQGRHRGFLDRVLGFGARLGQLLDRLDPSLEICHFRDPWAGVPILARPHGYATVYELNGLPSIELPYAYPHIARSTLEKIRHRERFCLQHADSIVTPSHTIAKNIVRLGADPGRIQVIPNGAEPSSRKPPRPDGAPGRYFIYFGALQPWQGVETLLRAFARLDDIPRLHLVICSSSSPRLSKPYLRLSARLGLSDRVVWRHGLGRAELAAWIAHACASVAPLTECSRNLDQGCAPLKILEAMALGVPVVASDLPAVREILSPGVEGRLVHPDRPSELARALRIVLEFPAAARALGEQGQKRQQRDFTWTASLTRLRALYSSLLQAPSLEATP
jgi:glycosyltransferase involved in cell wall biosynthesis